MESFVSALTVLLLWLFSVERTVISGVNDNILLVKA